MVGILCKWNPTEENKIDYHIPETKKKSDLKYWSLDLFCPILKIYCNAHKLNVTS